MPSFLDALAALRANLGGNSRRSSRDPDPREIQAALIPVLAKAA
jgi:hypothetical protein